MHENFTLCSIPKNEYIAQIITQNYEIQPKEVILHRNSGGMLYYIADGQDKYAFKVFSSYDINDSIHAQAFRAVESFDIMDYLFKNGFAVPEIHRTISGGLHTEIPMAEGMGVGALFGYVSGRDVEFEDIRNDIARATAAMHGIMKDYPGKLTVLGKDFYIGRLMKILHKYYKENEKIRELQEFGDFAFEKVKNLPKSFCHGDYGTHNIKIKDDMLYVFDFDVASGTFPMFDIALICDATNFWKFDVKSLQKTKENIYGFAEEYTKHCELSQREIDSYKYFLALRQYEVRASVAHNALYKSGSHFLNDNYLNSLHSWMAEFMKNIENI